MIVKLQSRLIVEVVLYPGSVLVVGIAIFSILALSTGLEAFERGIVEGARQYFTEPLTWAAALMFPVAGGSLVVLRGLFGWCVAVSAKPA